MSTVYRRVNWVNNSTPLNAENLNQMDQGIENITNVANELSESVNELTENVEKDIDHIKLDIGHLMTKLVTATFDSTTGTLRIARI